MSKDYSIEKEGGITTVRLHRKLTLDEILDVLVEVAQADTTNRRLWDLTEHFDFSFAEISTIAAHGRVHWPSASRVAYVAADQLAFGLLRMFEVFREQENYETMVFRNEQDALKWLGEWIE